MGSSEYLVSYGLSGEFGRFAAAEPVQCSRGDRVVIESRRGLEIGEVLCATAVGHARLMAAQPVRRLLRLATSEDELEAQARNETAAEAFSYACRRTGELGLPIEVLDVEYLARPELLVVHCLGESTNYRDLVHSLSVRFNARVEMLDLRALPGELAQADEHSCSSGACGSGNCGSCGSAGCGACGSEQDDEALQAHFTELRLKMMR
jgi:cell fate regulator YaaT (PSP1 superfamily)